ncbi:hypothetical protein D3C72_1701840 [compost metagenome]
MFDQADLDPRIAAAKAREHRREQRTAAERRQAQAQHTPLQALQVVQFGKQIVALRQHGQGAAVDDLACRGQLHGLGMAVQPGHAQLVLQLPHGLADRGLGGIDDFGGLGESALADDFDQSAQGAQFHSYAQ